MAAAVLIVGLVVLIVFEEIIQPRRKARKGKTQ